MSDEPDDDGGSAIIEFVFLAVIVMIPLIYVILAVDGVQRSELAVSQAAREAGRAFATADSVDDGVLRARAAVRIALQDQDVPDDVALTFVPVGASCTGTARTAPSLAPGARFTICVVRAVGVPAVPHYVTGRGITTIGQYTVYVDDYRAG